MSIIIAARGPRGEVCLGCDAITVNEGRNARVDRYKKIFRNGEFMMGATGPVIILQALELHLTPPPIKGDLRKYLITEFSPAVRTVMKSMDAEVVTPAEGTLLLGRALICVRGRIFEMDAGYAIQEPAYGYGAVGCADQEAHAAMFTARKLKPSLSARQLVRLGLEAASQFDLAIRPPFTFLHSRRP